MYCKKCNGYVPEGTSLIACPACGSPLAEPPVRDVAPQANTSRPVQSKIGATPAPENAKKPSVLMRDARRYMLILQGWLKTNWIPMVNGTLVLSAIASFVAWLHFVWPEVAGYALDFISIAAAVFFFFRFSALAAQEADDPHQFRACPDRLHQRVQSLP